jgi:hypothetical protein
MAVQMTTRHVQIVRSDCARVSIPENIVTLFPLYLDHDRTRDTIQDTAKTSNYSSSISHYEKDD